MAQGGRCTLILNIVIHASSAIYVDHGSREDNPLRPYALYGSYVHGSQSGTPGDETQRHSIQLSHIVHVYKRKNNKEVQEGFRIIVR
jgi:hypothetical protein